MEKGARGAKIISEINDLLEIVKAESDGTRYDKLMEKLDELDEFRSELQHLDRSLQEYLYTTENGNSIIAYNDFEKTMDSIPEDSLIIYVKKAQLYKIYRAGRLEDFEMDNNTHYRRREYGPAYEVVRDEHPQKLMVMVADDLKAAQLTSVRGHIVDFINKNPELPETSTDDMKIFINDNSTEFVVSSMQLQNLEAKEEFIEAFIRYMHKKGETELAGKIRVRPPPCEISGVRYYTLPSMKTVIGDQTYNVLDGLVSTVSQSNSNVVNIVINADNSVNNTNYGNIKNSNKKVIKTVKPKSRPVKKTLKTFYQEIYNTKPEWYEENKSVDIAIISQAYRDYFDISESDVATGTVSKILNGELFTTSTRNGNRTMKKLVSYNTLKTLF